MSLLALCAAPPLAAQSGGILAPPSATVDAPSVNTGAPAEPQAAPAEPLRLSLAQAIRMALENNLDIQIQQADQAIAKESVRRTEGGGTPRAINYSVAEPPTGETLLAMPLLSSTASTLSPTGISPTSTSVPSSFDVGHVLELQHSLLVAPAPFSPGTAVPAFDLNVQGQYAWIRRNPGNSAGTSASATAGDTTTTNNTLGNTTLVKGFATGTSIQLGINDFVQSFYSGRSSAVPFTHPNAIGLIAQPLLRGAGTANNRHYIAIAKTNRKISEAVLEQQMISAISGVEALYYDLIGFQNAVVVQGEALKAAKDLLSDNRQQLAVGRMPPIEVTRAEALVNAAQLALAQAEALQQQQGNILRSVIDPKSLSNSASTLTPLIATEELTAPSETPEAPLSQMFAHAWAQRPDIQQAKLQIINGERAVAGAANARRPEIDLYGSFQSRGVIIPSLVPIAGDPSTGTPLVAPVPAGGVRSSQVFEAGIQFNLPVQNKVAEADLGADRAQLRQERLRETQLEAARSREYDYATGNSRRDPLRISTYDQQYPSNHDAFGLVDVFGFQNITQSRINVDLSPAKNWTLLFQTEFLHVASQHDNVYNSGGQSLIKVPDAGFRTSDLGQGFDASTEYLFHKYFDIEVGVGHLFPGRILTGNGKAPPLTLGYLQLTYKFKATRE